MRYRVLGIALALAALTACSNHKVYSANGTTVSTDTSNKTVTVQTSGGTLTMGANVDAASLGVPIYTGATQQQGGSMSVTSKQGSGQMAAFETSDSFDKVYAFYKSKMPAGSEKMKVDAGGSSMAEFVTGGDKPGPKTMVMITQKDGKTSIVIEKSST
jgi:hypothetical protein